MKQNPLLYVVTLYVSAAVLVLVFLPGLINEEGHFSHFVQHLLIIAGAATFAYAAERLRQLAGQRKA
ncbi:hypothetical protein URH17368_1889 [Alicyclobacillus hesperidum URH17-3-68]|uniref:Uncharacterized protein n=1 Tax=Alicyclobacillus hesperidum TaxID=89784 RepID=A0A1H2QUC3_9BACL|nr:hypothetical protein [Alicyclobacillus hesperidum]EJY55506.1 hypothetical protein URH17368_1889 [Alicyclobacillus hesperidum URH17-3-68]GLV13294.1 hypothetical protein Heshes_09780 [Alicyclobacillus hesperidum]SDW10763.1 hypothetical protein SAMN04489725_10252 [Alicyclobacillus hesperidum]